MAIGDFIKNRRLNPMRPNIETDLKLGTGSQALTTYRSYIEKILQQIEIVSKNFEKHREDLKKSHSTLQTEIRNDVLALKTGMTDLNLERDELKKIMDAFTTERKATAQFIEDARKVHTHIANLKIKHKEVDKYLSQADAELVNKENIVKIEEKNIENILNNAANQEKKIIPWLSNVDATIKRVEGMEVVDQKDLQVAIDRDDKEIKIILQISARLKALQSKASTGFVNVKELESISAEINTLKKYLAENKKLEEAHFKSLTVSRAFHRSIASALGNLNTFKTAQDAELNSIRENFKKEQDDINRIMTHLKTESSILAAVKNDPTLKAALDKY